jgi:hypothetical protein
LAELSRFMFNKGERVPERQKLLRNLGIVEYIIAALQSPFKPYNTTAGAITLADLERPQHSVTLVRSRRPPLSLWAALAHETLL